MTFENLAFLWALPLSVIPIIIYYLMRYRSLKVVWGANYVLERALERLKKTFYLDQMILLALRVLACAALVMAFARPQSKASSSIVSSSGTHRVLILDTTYSMLAGEKNQTRWDRAKSTMKSLAATWGRGEVWSLYLLEEKPRWVIDAQTVETPEKTASVIDGMQISESRASLAKAMETITEKFPSGRLEIYLFADDQAASWAGMETIQPPQAGSPRIYWNNPPLEARNNLAVTAVRFAHPRGIVRHPLRLFVSVRNFSDSPVEGAELDVLVDGLFFGKTPVSLLPGQEAWTYMDLVFDRPGPHYATAHTGHDVLDFDNGMSAGVDIAEKLAVLVLADLAKSAKFDSSWEFLQMAGRVQKLVDEEGTPLFRKGAFEFTVCRDNSTSEALAAADVVVLDGGRAVTGQLASEISGYVSRGGGIILAADETVDAKAWNQLLGEAGLLPATLQKLRVEALGGERFQSVARGPFESEALRTFETQEDGDISQAQFFSWYEFGEIPEGTAVLARFSDQKPLVLRRRSELGCVLLLASGLSGRGNNLIAREFFLPFLFRLASEAASAANYPRTVGRGAPIGLRVKNPDGIKGMTFTMEGRDPVSLTPLEQAGELRVMVAEGSPVSGLGSILVARAEGAERVWYGVQGDRPDSDLCPLDPQLKKNLMDRFGIVEVSDWPKLEEILRSGRAGSEWHHLVVVALLIFLFLEMLLELRFL